MGLSAFYKEVPKQQSSSNIRAARWSYFRFIPFVHLLLILMECSLMYLLYKAVYLFFTECSVRLFNILEIHAHFFPT